ncbi:MAG: outer membrane lipoprotein-sorting protein [Pseudomonadota bacterium]
MRDVSLRLVISGLVIALFAFPALANPPANAIDVAALFQDVGAKMYPPSATAGMKITSFKKDVMSKTLTVEFAAKGDNVLIEILTPRVDKGKYILKAKDDLWMYFSRLHRSIRIATRDSFMGTDASNYDLLELDLVNDYELISHAEDKLEGLAVIRLELKAKANIKGYARIVSWLDPAQKIIIKNDCYAISGSIIKTISYSDYKINGDFNIPMKTRIDSATEPGRYSLVEFSAIKEDKNINDNIFSLGYLESLH